MQAVNVILCGVGGQGVLLAGELLGAAAMHAGYDVKMTSTHFSERDGESIACYIRWGRKVHTAIMQPGEADFILSLERMETLRYLPIAKDGVEVLMNDERISVDGREYPERIESMIESLRGSFHVIPAGTLAGGPKFAAIALLGAFASFNQCTERSWQLALEDFRTDDRDALSRAFIAGNQFAHEPLRIEVAHRTDLEDDPERGIRSFEEMLERVRVLPKRRVAIAGGQNLAALHAGIECIERGLGTPVFVGPSAEIRKLITAEYPGYDADSIEIVEANNEVAIAEASVAIVREGNADILLKGGVNTPILMRAVLSGKTGLRAGSLLSDTFVFEYPDEDGLRLIMITDGGVTLQPTVQQKVEILRNAVVVAHALGNRTPRVALLAASETINPNVAATMDAAVITKMNRTGQIPGCLVEGPMALDVAVSRKAAAIKGTRSHVAGQADILVTASIDTANVLAKSTTYFGGYRLSHIIVGGTAPILIPSRSDTADAKLLSVALGSLMAKWFEERRAEAMANV